MIYFQGSKNLNVSLCDRIPQKFMDLGHKSGQNVTSMFVSNFGKDNILIEKINC